jgi:phosphoribosylglycinamide formyltransferase 1
LLIVNHLSIFMTAALKLGVIGSGFGSNLQAILDAIAAGKLNAEVVLVLSDNPDAYILQRASSNGIPTFVIDCEGYQTKFPDSSQAKVAQILKAARVELVCLAGFMRLVKQDLLNAFPNRMINIHPSLLPAYPGLMAWKQALEDGACESGCTVHYVDAGTDSGAIILQAKVPILPDDTADSLHKRIQAKEYVLYPAAIQRLTEGSDPGEIDSF